MERRNGGKGRHKSLYARYHGGDSDHRLQGDIHSKQHDEHPVPSHAAGFLLMAVADMHKSEGKCSGWRQGDIMDKRCRAACLYSSVMDGLSASRYPGADMVAFPGFRGRNRHGPSPASYDCDFFYNYLSHWEGGVSCIGAFKDYGAFFSYNIYCLSYT